MSISLVYIVAIMLIKICIWNCTCGIRTIRLLCKTYAHAKMFPDCTILPDE